MRGFAVGLVIVSTLPIFDGSAVQLAFPPRFVVLRGGNVGVDCIMHDHVVGVLVGFLVGAGDHAEVARFRVDRAQPAVVIEVQPGNVVTERPDLPAWQRIRRYQHGQIGFAARGGKRTGNVVHIPCGAFETDNQHVLGQPAFLACLVAGDA